MVDNYILYINKKNVLRSAPIVIDSDSYVCFLKFTIPEKHLICGMILKGVPIKGDRLKDLKLKPIEKYLFEFSNIHFTLPEMEFNQENTAYNLEIPELADIDLFPFYPYPTVLTYAPTFVLGESRCIRIPVELYQFADFYDPDILLYYSIDEGESFYEMAVDLRSNQNWGGFTVDYLFFLGGVPDVTHFYLKKISTGEQFQTYPLAVYVP